MFKSSMRLETWKPDLWVFVTPLIWEADGCTVTVPTGFITDLASIPRALRGLAIADPNGVSRRPAGLHDWLYAGERSKGKDWADRTLQAALVSEGMSKAGAWTYYMAVHLFGGRPYAADGRMIEGADFATKADYDAWMATCPPINPLASFTLQGLANLPEKTKQ